MTLGSRGGLYTVKHRREPTASRGHACSRATGADARRQWRIAADAAAFAQDAARGSARGHAAHRHEARLRARRVRHVHGADRRQAGAELPPPAGRARGRPVAMKLVGRPLPKVDAATKVTGRALYADDIVLPRTLHCKILRSPHPHARILSIVTSGARRIPGVVAVITGTDLPIKF